MVLAYNDCLCTSPYRLYMCIILQLPEIGLLQLPSQPDTALYREDEMTFSAGGLHIEPVTVMKTWKLSYKGSLRSACVSWEQIIQ